MIARLSLAPPASFVDSSAYYALADADDGNHQVALTIGRRLIVEPRRLYTTNFVRAEAQALVLNRLGRRHAVRFLAELARSATILVRVTEAGEVRALAIIDQYDDKSFSLTDATSFAVMERLRLATAFTFDRDFVRFGFTALTPS